MKRLSILTLSTLSLLLGACASVPMASADLDARAKSFERLEDQSVLYIFRNEGAGSTVKIDTMLDGNIIGKSLPHTYFAIPLEPGRHTVTTNVGGTAKLDFTAAPGRNYFVWQEVKTVFLSTHSTLHMVDQQLGMTGVRESRLVAVPRSANGQTQTMTWANSNPLQKVAFRAGISSVTVERMAKENNCTGGKGAGLLTEPGPVEVYRMECEQGGSFTAKCELHQCQAMNR